MFDFNIVLSVGATIGIFFATLFLDCLFRFLCWGLQIRAEYWNTTKNGRHVEEIKEQFPYFASKNILYKSFMCGLGDVVVTGAKVVRRIVNIIYILLLPICVANIIVPLTTLSTIIRIIILVLYGSIPVRYIIALEYKPKIKLKNKKP